jgi:phenylalanyl-tRNA synthetase alpha chain
MTPDLDQLQADLLASVDASAGLDALDSVRVHALGKQGAVTGLLKSLGAMTPEERQTTGAR